MSVTIHPSAVVDPKAKLGENVDIGPFCVVEDNVELGDGTRLDAFATVKSHTSMGAGNRVHSYACVGGEPQDLKYHGEESRLTIGDNNAIREYVTIHRGTQDGGGLTSIGSGCLLMAYVHIAHDCHLRDGVILSNAVSLAGHVLIEEHASIGGMTGVHQYVRIGKGAFLGAMSGLGQDLPPYMLAAGARASLHGPNLIGLRRRKAPQETIAAVKTAYKRIFRSGDLRQDSLDLVLQEFSAINEVANLVDFIRSSERGVVSPAKNGDSE